MIAFISGNDALLMAVIFGSIFGALLHFGGVTRYNTIVRQFLFQDFTVLKIMFTAIVVGGAAIAILQPMGLVNLHVKPALMPGVIYGALIFGVGMVLYGYCPGTAVAATASGSLHAAFGFLGMIAGGIAYALSYPWITEKLFTWGKLGKISLPEISGVPAPAWVLLLAVVAGVVYWLIETKGPRTTEHEPCGTCCQKEGDH